MLLAGSVSYVFVYGLGPNAGTVMLALILAVLVTLVVLMRRADVNKPPSYTASGTAGSSGGKGAE